MEKHLINNKKVTFFAKSKGSNANKFNRAVKLAAMHNDLDKKMRSMCERGNYTSSTAKNALAVLLLLHTGIRVGNEGSAEGYMTIPHPHSKKLPEFVQTYGLTTLKVEHVSFTKLGVASLSFSGKKQVENNFTLADKFLANAMKKVCANKKKSDVIFESSVYELTKFIKTYVGKQFSAKDFRTLRANVLAWDAVNDLIRDYEPSTAKKGFKDEIHFITDKVSTALNNTKAVCLKSYIDSELMHYHELHRGV